MRKVDIKEKHVTYCINTIECMVGILALGGFLWQFGSKQQEQKEQNTAAAQELPASVFDIKDEAAHIFSPYLEELPKKGVPKEYVMTLASIPDINGKPYLSPGNILTLYNGGVSVEEANILLHFQGADGNPLFTVNQLIKTNENCSLLEAVALAGMKDDNEKPLLTGFTVYRTCQLGLAPEDLTSFINSKKPNALLIYPTSDYNDAFEKKEAIALFHEIQKAYDVKVAFATEDNDVAPAIDSVPDIELLILGGHGTTTNLNLGGDNSEGNINYDERYTIDTSDNELGDALNKLHPNATIFLNSCLTGANKSSGDNLANFIEKQAEGRRVIAATDSFEEKDIKIVSLYPFDMKIIRDITYNTKE